MKALDTNVLVRFLVRDDKVQAKAVYRIFKQAEADKNQFWVSLVVILEMLWVLESVYEIQKSEILDAIDELLIRFQSASTCLCRHPRRVLPTPVEYFKT